ncbi:hypothetical protein [Marisediminicola senii]|uniref:hypothetical protein n=1 Tax=Marisediminicola senii TaxID=2711233 RepID=UPI0013E9A395|nr:hypothetical protein [Marisediminicola senii]
MTNPTTTTRRRRTITAIAGLVVVAALIAAALFFANRSPAEAPEPTPTSTSTPTPSATIEPDAAPTGCLGGEERDAAMVLAAQEQAPQTSNGAIEVATAFVRWLNRFPYPTEEDAALVQQSGLAAAAPTTDLTGFFASNPNLSGGLVADGVSYFLSTVTGVYHLESASPTLVTASVGTAIAEEGAISPSLKGSITVTVAWEEDRWKFVSSEGTRTTEDLFAIGRPYTSGC